MFRKLFSPMWRLGRMVRRSERRLIRREGQVMRRRVFRFSPRLANIPVLAVTLLLLLVLVGGCSLNSGTTPADSQQTTISGVPVVRLTSPLPNATFLEGVTVNIQAQVTNAGADIERAEITVDGVIVSTLPSPNTTGAPTFSITASWPASGTGSHSIGMTVFRADGSSSAPASASINVVSQVRQNNNAGGSTPNTNAQPTATTASGTNNNAGGTVDTSANSGGGSQLQTAPTNPPAAPTNTQPPPATATTAPTNTPSVPMATFNQGVNVRSGPGTNFNPPIGSYAAGNTAEILAVNPARDWYKVRYYNGEGWVYASLMTTTGDMNSLVVDAGPPTPTPVPPTATPVPVTPTAASAVNLVAGNVRLDPAQPKCNQTFTVYFDVANLGSAAFSGSGSVRVSDVGPSNLASNTDGAFGNIAAGQTINIQMRLTVSVDYAAQHTITLTIDPNNAIGETVENDNSRTIQYTLDKAGC